MTSILDDIDSRPGSTTSMLRTFVGVYLRRLGGWISIADLIRLMDDLGVPATRTRTGVVRLKQRELLLPERVGAIGYRVNPEAIGMLERGDRRIFTVPQMHDDDPWCLVSFSIPESQRDLRHQLRRRLQWIGCGLAAPALWVCPDWLVDDVREIIDDLGVGAHAVLFRAEALESPAALRALVGQWWDLDRLREEHAAFITAAAEIEAMPLRTDAEAFAGYLRLIDRWRVVPVSDPALAPGLTPDDWPGQTSIDRFTALSARLAEPAWAHVLAVTGRPGATAEYR